MSVEAVRAVLERSAARGTDRLVLLVLAEHTNKSTGVTWPSVATIAKEAAVKPRAVQYSLRALLDLGELEIVTHGAPSTRPPQYRENLYRVLVSGAQPCMPDDGPVVHGGASPVVHGSVASGARNGIPVVHGGAPKPKENRKEPSDALAKATEPTLAASRATMAANASRQDYPCRRCEGSGQVFVDANTTARCTECNGHGYRRSA